MKRVRITCYQPIALDPTIRQPWADVWIRFKTRSGRPAHEYGPTLLSRKELQGDIRKARQDAIVLSTVQEASNLPEILDEHDDAEATFDAIRGSYR